MKLCARSGRWRAPVWGCVSVSMLVLAAACASTPRPEAGPPARSPYRESPPPPPPPPVYSPAESPSTLTGGTAGGGATPTGLIEIVRYIGIDRSKWPGGGTPKNLSDLYTRIEVETGRDTAGDDSGSANLRAYDKERRGALARLFSNRTITIATLARADLTDPNLSISLPLFSISHTSVRGTGETFVTDFMSSHAQAPLFRIRPNTAITLHVNAKISDDLKMQAASTVLKAVQTAVNIAAPTSAILTTLSKSDLSNASNAIDSALSGLFSQDLTEDIELGRLTDSWGPGAEVEVKGAVPGDLIRGDSDGGDKVDRPVDTWRIRLSCPRPSYFDPRDLCDRWPAGMSFNPDRLSTLKAEIVRTVSDASILQEALSAQITIQSFVQTQTWYTAFLQNNAKKAGDTKTFCANAMTSLYGAGLSRFDASLVLRAMATQMPGIFDLAKDTAVNDANCGALVDGAIKLG